MSLKAKQNKVRQAFGAVVRHWLGCLHPMLEFLGSSAASASNPASFQCTWEAVDGDLGSSTGHLEGVPQPWLLVAFEGEPVDGGSLALSPSLSLPFT